MPSGGVHPITGRQPPSWEGCASKGAPFALDGPINRDAFQAHVWDRIGILLDAFTPAECANDFETAAGYEPE